MKTIVEAGLAQRNMPPTTEVQAHDSILFCFFNSLHRLPEMHSYTPRACPLCCFLEKLGRKLRLASCSSLAGDARPKGVVVAC